MNQQAPPPATYSPQTQQLMDLCAQVAAGQMNLYPQLEALALRRQDELGEAEEAFQSYLEQLSSEVRTNLAREAELVTQLHNSYNMALDHILNYKADPKPETLNECALMLSFASNSLYSAMSTFEQRFLSLGPRKYPVVNLFANLSASLRAGKATHEGWLQTCAQYLAYYGGAIEEIDKSRHKNDPGVPERRQAFSVIVDCLKQFEGMNRSTAADQFETVLATFDKAHYDLDAAIETFNRDAASRPTPSVQINYIIMAARGVLDKTMHRDVLRNQLNAQLKKVEKTLSDLKLQGQITTQSALLQEEMARLLEGTELMEESLYMLQAFCEAEDAKPEAAEEALRQLEEATNLIHTATQAIEGYNERYGKVACPGCQTLNDPSSRHCSKCQRQLPQMTGSDVYGTWASTSSFQLQEQGGQSQDGPVITTVMKELAETAEGYQRGEIPAEELMALVERLEASAVVAQERLAKLTVSNLPPIPEDASEEDRAGIQEIIDLGESSVELMQRGVEDCEYGLAKVRQGLEEDSWETIREGVGHYFQGCQYMWQVKKIDDQFQEQIRKIEEAKAEQTDEEEEAESDDGLA